jgi:predicted O-methyltransferase YrrM
MKYWETVPGWFDYQNVYSWAVSEAKDGDTFVEVGAFLGRSSAYMMEAIQESGKKLNFYCVDLFKITPDDADTGGDGCMPWGENARLWKDRMGGDKLFETARWYLDHSPACANLKEMVQGDSAASAAKFEDGSVQYVFIDASHRYENVKRDLAAWWPKVKVGSYMTGHDWLSGEEVRQAVIEFAQAGGHQIATNNNVWFIQKK